MATVYGAIIGDGYLYETDTSESAADPSYWYSLRHSEVDCRLCGGEGQRRCESHTAPAPCDCIDGKRPDTGAWCGECSDVKNETDDYMRLCEACGTVDGVIECDTTSEGEAFEIVAWEVPDPDAFCEAVADGGDGYERLAIAHKLVPTCTTVATWEHED